MRYAYAPEAWKVKKPPSARQTFSLLTLTEMGRSYSSARPDLAIYTFFIVLHLQDSVNPKDREFLLKSAYFFL